MALGWAKPHGAPMTDAPSITIKQVERYKFMVDFGAAFPQALVDENPPIGEGAGPYPEQMLIAGVANCLCASLVFALGKFRQGTPGIEARATAEVARNEDGRLRVRGIDVVIALGAPAAALPRIADVLAQFERFCTVSESVKTGIPVSVSVQDSEGQRLK